MKFYENRLIIDGVVNEKHALLVSSVLMCSVGWMELTLDWFVLPEKINVFNMAVTESNLPKVWNMFITF